MKHLLFFIAFLFLSNTLLSQKTSYDFLTVVVDTPNEEPEKVIYYPEGSSYKIYLTKKDAEPIKMEDKVIYEGDIQLTIYPKYRKYKPEHFDIKGKRLRIFKTAKAAFDAGFGADWNYDNSYTSQEVVSKSNFSNGITLKKSLTVSKKNPNNYNATLTFSNGIVFNFNDGKYNAKMKGKYVDIKGEYMVKVKEGILKFSYNPSNGEVWWIFED